VAGQIKLVCRQGKSLDKRYDFYPYWRIKLIGDDGKEAVATIKYDALSEVLDKICLHELRVDKVRKRKPDFAKYRLFLSKLAEDALQLSLTDYPIPEVYKIFKGFDFEEEI
jgi:hypothetical protein